MNKIVVFLLCLPFCGAAQLKPGKIFSDNMVLQRDKPVHIWGTAFPQSRVELLFSGRQETVSVGKDGRWEVYFPAQAASVIPKTLQINSGTEHIQLKNMVIGDLWVCIGQSNMEFALQNEMHYKDEIVQTSQPLIRLYNPGYIGKNVFAKPFSDSMLQKLSAGDFYAGQWQTCDSNSAKAMSAIGYFFGKRMVAETAVPVGLIHLAIGGCPLETFISRQTLANSPQFAAKLAGNWLENEALPSWVKQRGKENIGAPKITYTDDAGPAHAYKPGFAFAAGIEPILGMAIKGVLLYQGESNAQEMQRVLEYRGLLKMLICDYRAKWKQPDLPFYWVQLSSIDTAGYKSQLWPLFRDEQRKLMDEISFGGMAVSSDLGSKNNVHPGNKKEVAERLARWALNKVYHKKITPSGPLPLAAVYEPGKVVISFRYADGLQAAGETVLHGFSTNGTTASAALIKGGKVIIPVNQKPAHVYYGWAPFTDANLVNNDNLPASTFKIHVQ